MNRRVKIILDTDIADDIDDAVTLAMALGSPEFDLIGVTTVFGDVETRTRVARRLVRLTGRTDVPVIPGFERPLQFTYHLGTPPEVCSQRDAVADDLEKLPPRGAAEFIVKMAYEHPGELYVCTIGAMTNVAAALALDPGIAKLLAGVYSNAGNLPPHHNTVPEWNTRYDILAGQTIARSGVPWCVLGTEFSKKYTMKRAELDYMGSLKIPHVQFLTQLMVLYGRNKKLLVNNDKKIESLADVQTIWSADTNVLWGLLYPEKIDFRQGRVEVDAGALFHFTPDKTGPHRMAFSFLPEGHMQEMLDRMVGKYGR